MNVASEALDRQYPTGIGDSNQFKPGRHMGETTKRRLRRMSRRAMVEIGTRAPAFRLHQTLDQTVALHDFCGRPLIVVFYPADWEPVSREQLTHYQALLVQFRAFGAALVAISMDSIWSHLAFAHVLQLRYPLLADVTPRGAVTQAYGVYSMTWDTPMRSLFVIDSAGVIRWTHHAPLAINPGANGILNALEALK